MRIRVEASCNNPSLTLAWNIAKIFGVTIEEVFTVTEDGEQTYKNQEEYRHFLRPPFYRIV